MPKKVKEKGFDDIIKDIYYFLKIKLKFDDFQATIITFSIFAIPVTLLLGFNGDNLLIFEYIFYFTIAILIVFCWYTIKKSKRRVKNNKDDLAIKSVNVNKISSIEEVNSLSGIDFEMFIGRIYKSRGYKVTYTKRSHDGGADLLAEKGRANICVQAKRWSKSVNKQAVYQAFFAMDKYRANKACIATNNELTDQAKVFANYRNIDVIDKYKIMEFLRNN